MLPHVIQSQSQGNFQMYDTSDRDGFMASHGQGLIETNSGEGHNSNSPLG